MPETFFFSDEEEGLLEEDCEEPSVIEGVLGVDEC
jgi:hypothetical protein